MEVPVRSDLSAAGLFNKNISNGIFHLIYIYDIGAEPPRPAFAANRDEAQ